MHKPTWRRPGYPVPSGNADSRIIKSACSHPVLSRTPNRPHCDRPFPGLGAHGVEHASARSLSCCRGQVDALPDVFIAALKPPWAIASATLFRISPEREIAPRVSPAARIASGHSFRARNATWSRYGRE